MFCRLACCRHYAFCALVHTSTTAPKRERLTHDRSRPPPQAKAAHRRRLGRRCRQPRLQAARDRRPVRRARRHRHRPRRQAQPGGRVLHRRQGRRETHTERLLQLGQRLLRHLRRPRRRPRLPLLRREHFPADPRAARPGVHRQRRHHQRRTSPRCRLLLHRPPRLQLRHRLRRTTEPRPLVRHRRRLHTPRRHCARRPATRRQCRRLPRRGGHPQRRRHRHVLRPEAQPQGRARAPGGQGCVRHGQARLHVQGLAAQEDARRAARERPAGRVALHRRPVAQALHLVRPGGADPQDLQERPVPHPRDGRTLGRRHQQGGGAARGQVQGPAGGRGRARGARPGETHHRQRHGSSREAGGVRLHHEPHRRHHRLTSLLTHTIAGHRNGRYTLRPSRR